MPPKTLPPSTPRRACRVEGEPTGTKQVAGVRRQRATPESPVHEGTEENRSELPCTERATRGSSTPPAQPKSSGRRGNPSGSNLKASRAPPIPSRPSEGKERGKGKTREARLLKKSTKGHRSSGSKVSEQS